MIVGHPVWLCHDVKKCRHVIHEELSEDLPDSLFSDPRISPDLKSKQSFFHSHTWTLAHIFSIPFKWKSLPGLRDHWQPTLSKIHQQVSMKANRWSVSTGWHISLFPTSCWHKKKGCVLVYGPYTIMQLLVCCQWEVGNKLMHHPVERLPSLNKNSLLTVFGW